jgi:hypothetical protein
MKTALRILLTTVLAALALTASAQDKLPIWLEATTQDLVGQKLVGLVRNQLSRSNAVAPAVDPAHAVMVVHLVSVQGQNSPDTAYAVSLTMTDSGAFTGEAQWDTVVGLCSPALLPQCAASLVTTFEQTARAIQAEQRRSSQPKQEQTKRGQP